MADEFTFDGAGFYPTSATTGYLSASKYYADPAPEPSLNATLAKELIAKCPAWLRYLHPRLNPEFVATPATKAMQLGSVAHVLFLGRGPKIEVVEHKDRRSKQAKEDWAKAEQDGKLPVTEDDYQELAVMVTAAKRQLAAIDRYAFDSDYGYPELAVFARDPVGPWTRALIDWYGDRHPDGVVCWDYKTTSASANPDTLRWHMNRQGWAFQAAFQDRILSVLRPALAGKIRYRFFVQENEPPYLCSVVEPGSDAMLLGHKMVAAAIGWFNWCLMHDTWLGYPSEARSIPATPWIEAGWLEREMDPLLQQIISADPFLNKPVAHEAKTVSEVPLEEHTGFELPPVAKPKNRGGRPRMTDEQKANAKAARLAARQAAKPVLSDLPVSTPRKLDL